MRRTQEGWGECPPEFPFHALFSVSSLEQPLAFLTLVAFLLFSSFQAPHLLHFWKWVHFPTSLLVFSVFFRIRECASAVTPVCSLSPLVYLPQLDDVNTASQEKLFLTTSPAILNLKGILNTISSHLFLLS